MNKKQALEKAQIINDINEIESVLNNQLYFDKNKAIQIIEKHHFTDWNVMIADLILNVNRETLQYADNNQIARYLWFIDIYLNAKLVENDNQKGVLS